MREREKKKTFHWLGMQEQGEWEVQFWTYGFGDIYLTFQWTYEEDSLYMSCIYEVDSCIFEFEVQKTCLNKKSEFEWQRHIDVINNYKITVLDVGREKKRIKHWDLGNLRNLENEEKPTKEIEINNNEWPLDLAIWR